MAGKLRTPVGIVKRPLGMSPLPEKTKPILPPDAAQLAAFDPLATPIRLSLQDSCGDAGLAVGQLRPVAAILARESFALVVVQRDDRVAAAFARNCRPRVRSTL